KSTVIGANRRRRLKTQTPNRQASGFLRSTLFLLFCDLRRGTTAHTCNHCEVNVDDVAGFFMASLNVAAASAARFISASTRKCANSRRRLGGRRRPGAR